MATQFKHNYKEFSTDAISKRVSEMLKKRDEVDVDNAHVKFSYGNRKTGALVPSVSLIPIADCGNCKVCSKGCYDIRNVCFQKTVQNSRANNSAIYKNDPTRYMWEITEAVKFLRFFRWHVGGDIKDPAYLVWMAGIAQDTPTCEFLCFTKMYGIVNDYLDIHGEFPKNLHIIFSDWRGAEFENPYNLPDEDFARYKEDCFSMYEETGFSETFHSPYDDESYNHNGKPFKVLRRATIEECDLEAMPLWVVKFDGEDKPYYCHPEEICKIELIW